MSLHIILGGADAEKTQYCFDMIEQMRDSGENAYIIVPDQFSYAAEKTAIKRLGGLGLNGVEVLTFNRIVFRIRQKVTLPDYITASGREMLICRAVKERTDEKSIFYGCIDKDGFINVISGLISEFKRYSITVPLVYEQSEKASNKALSDKLRDIAKIYERYEELIDGNFSDSDNDLDIAAEFIQKNRTFGGTKVFFDEFSDFLPQNMRVVEEIMKNADDVYVTLCIPENTRVNDDTFDTCRTTYSALRRIARENGIDVEDIILPDSKKRSAEIKFLIDNWNSVGARYNEPTENITMFYAKNPYSEAEYAASEIIKLVRDDNMRFRDIAVLCGSMDAYAHIIESVFREYSIPYFTDETTAVTDHPVITAVTAVFDILENDWRYEDVFRYLRSGFIYKKDENENTVPIDNSLTDKLENYVLRWGISGKRQWLSDEKWQKRRADVFGAGGTDEIDEELDDFRHYVAMPIERFREKASGKNAAEKAVALFAFLEQINMPDGIEAEINELRSKGYMDEAAQFEQVWELLIEAIEQVYVTMKEENCSMKDFARYIRAGLSKCDIRIIPSSLDHIAVGTMDRSRNSDVKYLFVLGANFGMMPPEMNKEGILSNRDREEISQRLSEYNLTVAPDTKKRDTAERYKLYRSICAAREGLHISYSAGNDGDTLRPSQFVVDIARMFPRLETDDDMIHDADTAQTARTAFRALMLHLDDCGGVWADLRRRFEEEGEYSEKLRHILSSCRAAAGITEQTAKALFEEGERSVTQFEKYASCPYSYFLKYGLKLREREVWEINGINIGNLCHRIVQKYCEKVSEGLENLDDVRSRWHHITDEESTGIISRIIDDEVSNGLERAVHGKGHLRSVLNRIRRIVYASVNTINESLRCGEYAYSASEKPFSYEIGSARIRGVIDRVDITEKDGKAYIRIIDYKSGKQGFDIAKIAEGLNLQLVTYAIAAKNLYNERRFMPRQGNYEDVRIGGILYNKIRDDIAKAKDVNEAMKERDKNRKMSGMVFADTPEEVSYMDLTLKNGSSSSFLPISVNKDGKISKHSICEMSEMAERIIRHTESVIEKAQNGILSGKIPIRPYQTSNSTPCTYCEYGAICRFDPEKDSYRKIVSDKERAVGIICGEVSQ